MFGGAARSVGLLKLICWFGKGFLDRRGFCMLFGNKAEEFFEPERFLMSAGLK
jgi:hypothetical protein